VVTPGASTSPTDQQWRRWGVDPGWSRSLDVPGHDGSTRRWHLLERSPSAPIGTIVCVHGNPTWSYLWRSMLARFGDRYRVIAVDQLGMGFSERIGPRTYAQRVADLDDVLGALSVTGPVVLMGQDWGGAVVMGWAVEHPERVDAMVLCNTGIAVPEGRRAPWLIRLAASSPMLDLVCHRTRTFVEGTLRLSWSRIAPDARDAYRAPYRHAAGRHSIKGFVADVPFDDRHPSAAALADVATRLRSTVVPTLLVWGAKDPVFDDSFALDLAARMPHAQQHRLDAIGHLSPEEADVAAIADAWLADQQHDMTSRRDVATRSHNVSAEAGRPPVWAALDERADDDAVAFVDGATGARITFRELHRRVMGVAAGLADLGLRPGDRVAMLTPPGIDLVTAVYAVWRAGGVTVVADRGLGLRGLGNAVRGARVDWVIGPRQALAAAAALRWASGARRIAVGAAASMGAVATLDELSRSTAALPHAPEPDDEAAVLYTSGATGPAKGVRYRHHQLAAQRDALAATYAITRADTLVAAFAPFALYGPALGIASTIPDVDVTKPGTLTAEALGAACASVGATIVFASPAALANVVRTATGRDARLDRVRLALSAGAPVPVATLRAMAGLVPSAEWHTPYGMTECLPVADISLTQIEAAGEGRGVCVGHPVPGASVTVAALGFDASTPVEPVSPGTTGELLVRTPWLSDGYDRRWATEHHARPVDADGARWHRTGDVGHLDADGNLWVEGRSVHVIDADTGPITPVPLEVAVERLDGIDRCAAVGVGPRGCQVLVIVVERPTQRDRDDGLADPVVAGRVRSAVGHPVAAVLQVSSLPVDIRHNTKIDRTLVATWAADVLAGGRVSRPW